MKKLTDRPADPSRYPVDLPDTALLPKDPETGEVIWPRPQPGYYAGYEILGQKAFWDAATREVVTGRVDEPPRIRYFNPEQVRFWRTVFDHLIPQDDRTSDRRIGMVEPLDQRLYENKTKGYRYASMPQDREAIALGEQAINEESQQRFSGNFVDLPFHQSDVVLKALHDGEPEAAKAIWKKMSVARFWQMLMEDALEAYYKHPWSWDEIGFGGPAYPRAYTRLERGEPEPWEVKEQRYEWVAPSVAVSHETEATHHLHTEQAQNG